MYEYFKDAKPEGKNDVAAQFLRASVWNEPVLDLGMNLPAM
jgi:hypothetical protein